MKAFRLVAFAVVSIPASLAQAGTLDERRCDFPPSNPAAQFFTATVNGEPGHPAQIYSSGPKCPAGACRSNAYVIPGDRLLVSSVNHEWACALFPGPDKNVVGWIKADRLNKSEPAPLTAGAWQGRWRSGRNSFKIETDGSKAGLAVVGVAVWGAGPAPNNGLVEGTATVKGNRAVLEDGPCRVRLTLLEQWLIAEDNGECGGLNVTFNGIYKRTAQ